MDSFFLASREELLAFFQAYRKEVALPFFAQLYPEQMLASPDILKEACHAGMVDTVIGIQSGSERVNRQIFNRSLPNSKLVKFADMLASYNDLRVDYHLITHNPFESEEDFQVALDLLKRLPKENANLILQRLRPFVNTNVEQLMREADLSEVNQEILDKRFLLYLLRYTVPDEEFEKLIVDSRSLSFEDLKTAYRDVRSRVKDSMSWTDEGWSRYHSQDYDGAIEAFDHALLMERTHYRALVGRGWSNLQKSRYEPAEESFVKAAQLVALDDQQSRQEIFRGLGWSYYHRNDDSRAIESFGRALDYTLISETNVRGELLRALSWSHQRAGRPEMAKEFLIEEQRFLESPFEGVHPRTCPIFDSTRLTPRNRIMVGRARKALSPLYRLLRSIWFKFVGAKKMTV
jgi:tetratricopeptide (TPR) repeat protein